MAKHINWDQLQKSNITNSAKKMSIREAIKENDERIQAVENFQKSINALRPALDALLLIRLKNHDPLKVTKSFKYLTSDIRKAEVQPDEDPRMADFYANEDQNSENNVNPLNFDRNGKCHVFQDVERVIPAGETLILKSLVPTMQQFIFADSKGREHEISYTQKDALLFNTDIFDIVNKIYNGNKE